MSFTAESRERSRPVLPLAAMVDVLFLLLIFFMTASVFRERESLIDIVLPTAETAQPAPAAATRITITISADNRVFLGEREVSLGALRQTLTRLTEQFPAESVVIRGDTESNLGLVVRVIDTVKEANIYDVSIATVKSKRDLE